MNTKYSYQVPDYDEGSGADYRRKGSDRPQRRSQTQHAMARNSKFATRRNSVGQKGIHRRRVRKIQW